MFDPCWLSFAESVTTFINRYAAKTAQTERDHPANLNNGTTDRRRTLLMVELLANGDPTVQLRHRRPEPPSKSQSTETVRKRSAFAMTLTDDNAIAAAATTGESSKPKNGYSTPAASGMPATL